MKKVLFITGTRADYGKLKPLMKAVEENRDFELYVYVSGMHTIERFGSTYNEVINDGYKNIFVAFGVMHIDSMSSNLGNTICDLSGYVQHIKPDLIVVHGDRIDALSGAVVGALNNIMVAHIEGGELSGTIDESIRHAITKFAHIHFVSNDEAKQRLIQLGEPSQSIHVIGSPDIDIMISDELPDFRDTRNHYSLKFDKYGIFIYHPVTTEYKKTGENISTIIDALINAPHNYVVVYPNNDMGSEIILDKLLRLENNDRFAVFPSIRFEYFLTLLKNAEFIIGNSSSGIREACVYGIPSIDIGSRQKGRYNTSINQNIIHVDENKNDILDALSIALSKKIAPVFHFGKGNSKSKFMEILNSNDLWDKDLQKIFVDVGD